MKRIFEINVQAPKKLFHLRTLSRMVGSVPSGWMRKILLFLVLTTGVLLIAMYAHAPPLASLQPFSSRRLKELQRGLVTFLVGNDSVIIHLQQIEFVTVNTSDQETKNLLEHAKDVFIVQIILLRR